MQFDDILDELAAIGTATLAEELSKQGIHSTAMAGVARLSGTGPVAAHAVTVQYLPGREDIATFAAYGNAVSLTNTIEAVAPNCALVISTGGKLTSGVIGDLLAKRFLIRGGLAIISDGAVRDIEGLRKLDMRIWAAGTTAPGAIPGLLYAGSGQMIGCGGVLVQNGDVVVADDDGVIVMPGPLVRTALASAREAAIKERFINAKLDEGVPLSSLYPPQGMLKAEFEAWRARTDAR